MDPTEKRLDELDAEIAQMREHLVELRELRAALLEGFELFFVDDVLGDYG